MIGRPILTMGSRSRLRGGIQKNGEPRRCSVRFRIMVSLHHAVFEDRNSNSVAAMRMPIFSAPNMLLSNTRQTTCYIFNARRIPETLVDRNTAIIRFPAGLYQTPAHRSSDSCRRPSTDLRDNSGGLLDQAAAVAGRFLDGGTVFTVVGRAGPRPYQAKAEAGRRPPLSSSGVSPAAN
jgi:hypothetical protein